MSWWAVRARRPGQMPPSLLRRGHGALMLTATLACTLVAGCTGQNLYTTPRTLGEEQGGQGIVAPQLAFRPKRRVVQCFVDGEDQCAEQEGSPVPLLHAAYRTGIGGRGEVGFHGGADTWGVDGKWNAVRTRYFDIALLGRLSIAIYSLRTHRPGKPEARSGMLLHLPVLLGFNLGRFTFVASPGYTVAGDAAGRLTHALRAGAGVQVRVTSGFALMPEASILHDVYGPTWLDTVTVGLGFIFPNLADSSRPPCVRIVAARS